MDHTVAGVIVHVDDVGHGEDAGQGHLASIITSCSLYNMIPVTAYLVGEGGHGDPLPGAGDQGRGAGGEVRRV